MEYKTVIYLINQLVGVKDNDFLMAIILQCRANAIRRRRTADEIYFLLIEHVRFSKIFHQ